MVLQRIAPVPVRGFMPAEYAYACIGIKLFFGIRPSPSPSAPFVKSIIEIQRMMTLYFQKI